MTSLAISPAPQAKRQPFAGTSLISKVIKRDNEIVPFEKIKIIHAISQAFRATGEDNERLATDIAERVVARLEARYHGRTIPAVEEIQDVVENALMEEGHHKVAKAYILYREQRSLRRSGNEKIIDVAKVMEDYLGQADWRVKENSSVNYSIGGLILHNSGAITANYWLNNVYPQDVSDAHRNGDVHIHDLSMFSGYCAGWSLRQLLQEGFGGVNDKINSKPAKHLSTAILHMINFLGTMQNEWAGAQAFASFDTYLAPFIKSDKLSYKEVKQNIQSFVYSVNTTSRWGSQAPFSNITLDWNCPEDLKHQKVMIGGKEADFTYGDCQQEMEMINKAFLEIMMEGDADGRGFAYPIPTYNITRDFDWDSENSKLLFEMTAKYGTPYFQNFINSDLNPSDVRSMCCRLQLDKRELRKRGGGLFGADEFTGSIGVVTINLPRIGYMSKTRQQFFNRLNQLMEISKVSLELKRKVVSKLLEQGLFPYTKRYLKHMNNHFSTIGINGMHECCLNFLGSSIATPEGQEFAKEVLQYMRKRMADFQEETGNLYNLEATPAESTAYRFARIDKKKLQGIIQSGGEDDGETYYTNSSALPVDFTDDLFSALELQEELQSLYTGGTVFHAFLGESVNDVEACKTLVKKIAGGYKLPYFSISPTFTVCKNHGMMPGEHEKCPNCGEETEVYSRITGYYRPVKNWNKGKQSEYKKRKEYSLGKSLGSDNCKTLELKGGEWSDKVAVTEGLSFKFFYSENCTKCPPVKEYIKTLGLNGEFVNAYSPEGMEEAQTYGVRSLPSVVFLDNGIVLNTAHSIEGIRQCLSVASSATH